MGVIAGLGYASYAAVVMAGVLITNTVLRPLAYKLHPQLPIIAPRSELPSGICCRSLENIRYDLNLLARKIPKATFAKTLPMPLTLHTERHFTFGELVRDIVIGMSDGLTVPFALAAGLSGAVGSTHLVITAGLAEIAAGSIAMGLGGYLAARGDADHYAAERRREEQEITTVPEEEKREVAKVFKAYGLTATETVAITEALAARPKAWIDFMMRFELGLEEPEPGRALRSAATIAVSYIAGGLIPLAPYFLAATPAEALRLSIGLTLLALAVFGFLKGKASGTSPLRSAIQTTSIGGLAAAAAFALAKAIS